jgi:hypothetical protein
MPKIRFIVETVTSAPDASGNSYHFARITSTATGKYLRLETGGVNNALSFVNGICDGEQIYCANLTLPKKQWSAQARRVDRYEHTTTEADVLALEH